MIGKVGGRGGGCYRGENDRNGRGRDEEKEAREKYMDEKK